MRVAVVQLAPVKGDIDRNLEAHIGWIKQAVSKDADLVVFPELSLTGYEPELARALASHQNDKRLDRLQQLSNACKITIGVGLPTREKEDLFISMILFRPEKERLTYSKQFLYPTEVPVFTAGSNPLLLAFETDVVAPAICYELSNREHYEYAARHKASVYLASVLNSVEGVEADLIKLGEIARQYKMVTFMANYTGTSGGYRCAGRSTVWNEKGEVMQQLGEGDEGLLVYDTVTKQAITVTSTACTKQAL